MSPKRRKAITASSGLARFGLSATSLALSGGTLSTSVGRSLLTYSPALLTKVTTVLSGVTSIPLSRSAAEEGSMTVPVGLSISTGCSEGRLRIFPTLSRGLP